MKKQIQHTIKPKYSIGNNDLSDFIPLLFAVVLAYFLPIPFGFKALIIYIGWEAAGLLSGLKKYFPRSFLSYVKYRFNLSTPSNLPTQKIKEFAG